jgi:hypothetical protein
MSIEYYDDDDGERRDPDPVNAPSLCTVCEINDDPPQPPMCNLNRLGQAENDTFQCGAYVPLQGEKPTADAGTLFFNC